MSKYTVRIEHRAVNMQAYTRLKIYEYLGKIHFNRRVSLLFLLNAFNILFDAKVFFERVN